MKVSLYMAVSIDGYIAKKGGDSDWVSEVDSVTLKQKIKETDCIIVGRKTFDQYQGELYPVKGVTNIVLTSDGSKKREQDNVVFVKSPQEAIKAAEEKSRNKILLIGGGTINGVFLKEGLIGEVFLSVHPLILGDGIKLFENSEVEVSLELLEVKKLEEGLVQLYYKVKK